MLTILAQTDGGSSGSNAIVTIVFYAVVIGGLFYFLMIRPQRSRMKKHQDLVSSLDIGDEVQTVGGIVGTIEFLDDQYAVLGVEGGGRLRVVRRALADKIQHPEPDLGDEL
ncbi:MAG: preprotein translocase subunit YajC [Acidimicrobiia bacterium]|nr:preprotein translocase subunit YajC [Acidimicrobiia bacterium]